MNLPIILSILSTVFFGILGIFFSLKEQKTRFLLENEKKQKNKNHIVTVLKEIQDRINYSLEPEKIIDSITVSLRTLIPHSMVCSSILKKDFIILKSYAKENVNKNFLETVQKNNLKSLYELVLDAPKNIDERFFGESLGDLENEVLSFFNIPVVKNDRLIGIINVSSSKKNIYKEEEMETLYNVTRQSMNQICRLEKAFFAENSKLSSMIASLVDGIFMLDRHKNLLLINDSAKKFLGIDKNNPDLADIAMNLPEDFDIESKLSHVLKTNSLIHVKDVAIKDKCFEIYIKHVSNGTISVLMHDLTTEKNLEHIKEDFTNMIVHELRAPLTTIKDSSELIMSEKYSLSENDKKQFLEIINKQSKVLLDQISSILDSAKIESGKFTVKKIKGDIKKTIKEDLETFLPQATKKHITLKEHMPVYLPLLAFDPLRISQVMNNFLSNSLKFTQEGGEITVSASFDETGKEITISVSDNGIGIPKEYQNSMFSKFSQANNNPQKLTKDGSGLGLYVAKGIIEAHKGVISLDSEQGRGTTISFTLPISANEAVEKDILPKYL